jgi:putative Mg2+ transporter-C (MgtC) family protein
MRFSTFPVADQAWLVARVGFAALLGGVVGWERDRAGKSAGIRTHMLVGAAAALAVGLGEVIRLHTGSGDPMRMMHAVVTGIGFIGGGMIWTQKRARHPYGLTSAATVVLVATIGAASGLGAPIVAPTVTAFALVTLVGVRLVEERLRGRAELADGTEPNAEPEAHDLAP